MGIDYVIPHPCRNREELGENGLRRWTFLYMIYKYIRNHPELARRDLSGKQWNLPLAAGAAGEVERFSYEDVQDVGERIGIHLRRCRECPANLDPQADEFGCVGRVNYPIQRCFEELLAERVQRVIDRRGHDEWPTLLNLILRHDSPFDGKPIAALRSLALSNKARLFELEAPVRLERAGDGISSDNILHALLGMASGRAEETGYSREIPKELLKIYLDFLTGVLYASLSEERVLEFSRRCNTYLQFRWLHRALRLSYRNGHSLLIN